MTSYRAFTLDDGRTVLVEVEPSRNGNPGPAGLGDRAAAPVSAAAVKQQLSALSGIAQTALDEFRRSLTPQEITLTLGVKFTVEGSIVVAKSAAEASLEIALCWKDQPVAGPDPTSAKNP